MRVLFALGFLAARLWGCSCAVSPTSTPPCHYLSLYEVIFTGTVTDITEPERVIVQPGNGVPPMMARRPAGAPPLPFPKRKVRFKITEALTGIAADQKEIVIETGLGGGDCGYGFQIGSVYIVYAGKYQGALGTGICSPTRPIEKAAEDLKYFHGLANAPPGAELRVTVFDYSRRTGGWPPGVPSVVVTIDGMGVHLTSKTDEAGRHVFSKLPAGEYTVDASLDGYARPEGLRPVRLHDKGCAEVPLFMTIDRKLTGRVMGANGLPAAGVVVEAMPARPQHEKDLPSAADSFKTDADGRYELRHLLAGDYYVGVSLARPPSVEQPYTRWFFPGTEDPKRAVIVHIGDEPGSQNFDLTLPPRQHERLIRGTVLQADGTVAQGAIIFLEDPRFPWRAYDPSATTDGEGRFIVHALDGTSYRLHVFLMRKSAAPVAIEPGADPVELMLALTRTGVSLRDDIGDPLESWKKGLGLP